MTRKSFFTTYGLLSFLIIFLTIFGWFHFKTGPSSGKCMGRFTKVYTVVILIISEGIIIQFIVSHIPSISINGENLLYSLGVGFFVFLLILLPVIVYLSLKKGNNTSSLIIDIHERRPNLSLGGIIGILLCGTLALASLAYCWYNWYLDIRKTVLTGRYDTQNLFINYNVSSFLGNQAYLEPLFDSMFFTSIFGAIIFTSLTVSLICLYLGNEFETCFKELSYCLNKTNNKSTSSVFQETKIRFQNLGNLVRNISDHFSFYIGYNILVSLLVLCGMAYALTLTFKDMEVPTEAIPDMMIPVVIMSVNVFLLTIPVSYLHTKVSVHSHEIRVNFIISYSHM